MTKLFFFCIMMTTSYNNYKFFCSGRGKTVEAEIKTDRALTGSWDNENPAERSPSNGPLRVQGKGNEYTAT